MTDRELQRDFRARLRKRLEDEKNILKGLHCPRDAWKVLRVAFDVRAAKARFWPPSERDQNQGLSYSRLAHHPLVSGIILRALERDRLEYEAEEECLDVYTPGARDLQRIMRLASVALDAEARSLSERNQQPGVPPPGLDEYIIRGGVVFLYDGARARSLLGPEQEEVPSLDPYLNAFDPSVIDSSDEQSLQTLLGGNFIPHDRGRETTKLTQRVQRAMKAKRWTTKSWLLEHSDVADAVRKEYVIGRFRRMVTPPKWLAAQSAAVADAVLRNLNDPIVSGMGMQALENFRAVRVMRDLRAADPDELAEVRKRGGAAAAHNRHTTHEETKVKAYRDEYRNRLRAAKEEFRADSLAALSPKIIANMAKKHGEQKKRMRDLIKPQQIIAECLGVRRPTGLGQAAVTGQKRRRK